MTTEQTYVTLPGLTVKYTPTPAVADYLERLAVMASDPTVTEGQLIAAVYSTDNPLMDAAAIPGRGAVTAAVLADPAYRVMADLLFRKQVAVRGVDLSRLASRYTLTVVEAAERLGVSRSAVHQAVEAGRLGAWMRSGQLYIDPAGLAAMERRPRGPKPQRAAGEPPAAVDGPLSVRVGSEDGYTLKLRHAGEPLKTGGRGGAVTGEIKPWRRAAVLRYGRDGKARLLVLEPSAEEQSIEFGPLWIRGPFAVVDTIKGDRAARAAWETFQPA